MLVSEELLDEPVSVGGIPSTGGIGFGKSELEQFCIA